VSVNRRVPDGTGTPLCELTGALAILGGVPTAKAERVILAVGQSVPAGPLIQGAVPTGAEMTVRLPFPDGIQGHRRILLTAEIAGGAPTSGG
jgi:hypothetical protein